jgi:dUTP pyrophosphatase
MSESKHYRKVYTSKCAECHEDWPCSSAPIILEAIEPPRNVPDVPRLVKAITFYKLRPEAFTPIKAHASDVGWDISLIEDMVLHEGRSAWGRTGLAVIPPTGYYCRVLHRSSTYDNHGVLVREGTVDPGFRGELLIALQRPITGRTFNPWLEKGTKIAQLILAHHELADMEIVDGPPPIDTDRGTAGFGSTGE